MNTEAIYRRLPVVLQSYACTIQGWLINRKRYGDDFCSAMADYRSSDGLSSEELLAIQRIRLTRMLKIASQTFFWKSRFQEYTLKPDDDDPFTELMKLPILTKMELQSQTDELMPAKSTLRQLTHSELLKVHTSGTTGSGLAFWETAEANAERWACWWRYRGWHGITRDIWCGYFGGRSIVPAKQNKPPFWRVNYAGRQVIFSAYHLTDLTATAYLDAIKRRHLTWLHGYPSVLALVADYALRLDIDLSDTVRLVTTGAESLLSHQRQLIQQAFGVVVREHYGQAEGVANFSECPSGRLHVDEDYALVEFLPTSDPGQFRIVGTNLTNPAFPLLRYDTQDLATLSEDKCECGRRGRIVSAVDGRKEDYLILSDGSRVGRLDHIFKDIMEVREAQFQQSIPGHAHLYIVRGHNYSDSVERRLRAEIMTRIGDRAHVEICYTERIERTATGKLRFVISSDASGRIDGGAGVR